MQMGPQLESIIDQVLRRTASPDEVGQFLKSRRAHVTLSDTNGQSFNGRLLRPQMEIAALEHEFHITVKRMGTRLCITVYDKASGKTLIDTAVNVTDSVQKLSVTIDTLELTFELDAAPSNVQ
jgi:hypothetical protein